MRVLLDENFPTDFAKHLSMHQVHTVHSLGWSGIKNGQLLKRAHEVCDVFVTLDRNLEFQQNIKALTIGLVVVKTYANQMKHLIPLASSIDAAIQLATAGTVTKAGLI